MRPWLALTAALWASPAPAQDDVDALIRQFKEDWHSASRDEARREALVASLAEHVDDRVVGTLIPAFEYEPETDRVRAKIAEVLGAQTKSEKAAEFLSKIIRKHAKPDEGHIKILMGALLGMSRLDVSVSRTKERVAAVAAYLSNKDNRVAASAARCLACMRSPDTVESLLDEMFRNQATMKNALFREKPDNCDGA